MYLSRAQVGYRTDLPRRGYLTGPISRNAFVEHHTVGGTRVNRTEAAALDYVRRLQTIRPDLGSDVPYNFVVSYISPLIGSDRLLVCEGRGWHRTGAHTLNHNTEFVAFSWQGDWHAGTAPKLEEAQAALGAWAISEANLEISGHNLATNLVYGHREFKNTTCPGDNVYATRHRFVEGMEGVEMTPEQEAAVNQLVEILATLAKDPGTNRPSRVNGFGLDTAQKVAASVGYADFLVKSMATRAGQGGDRGDLIAAAYALAGEYSGVVPAHSHSGQITVT